MLENRKIVVWASRIVLSLVATLVCLYFLASSSTMLLWKEGFIAFFLMAFLGVSKEASLPENRAVEFTHLALSRLIRSTLLWVLFLALGTDEMRWLPFALYPILTLASQKEVSALSLSLLSLLICTCFKGTDTLLNLPFAFFPSEREALLFLFFLGTFFHAAKRRHFLFGALFLFFFAYTLEDRLPILNLLFFLSYGLLIEMNEYLILQGHKAPYLPLSVPITLLLIGHLLGLPHLLSQGLILSFSISLALTTFLHTLSQISR